MHAVFSSMAIALAAVTASTASAHRTHHSHVMRGLQTDMMGMSDMNMTSSTPMEMTSTNTTTSGEEYECPVCGMSTKNMGYNNLNHIGFANGQTVYTCGMAARSFDDYDTDLTDAAYLAANVAEFIVSSKDTTAYAECEDSCDECENGIKDPVTGDDVTTSNYQYVCLKNGQKIYFASTDSKNEYLRNVNSKPRYLVDSIICKNETCSDAKTITALSTAAKAFVPESSTSNSSGTAPTSGSSTAVSVSSPTRLAFAVASALATLALMA